MPNHISSAECLRWQLSLDASSKEVNCVILGKSMKILILIKSLFWNPRWTLIGAQAGFVLAAVHLILREPQAFSVFLMVTRIFAICAGMIIGICVVTSPVPCAVLGSALLL